MYYFDVKKPTEFSGRETSLKKKKNSLTSSPGLAKELDDDIVVSLVIGYARVLDQLLLDRNADVIFGQQLFQLLERLHAVVRLLVHDRYISPVKSPDDLHHGFDLVQVGRYGPREVLEPLFVAQLRAGRPKRDLGKVNEVQTWRD